MNGRGTKDLPGPLKEKREGRRGKTLQETHVEKTFSSSLASVS
jgi:hypothetical protein